MARDAAARLYDVEKNTVTIDIAKGLITFQAKKDRSIDVDRLHASLKATRLADRTGMEVRYLELNARGKLTTSGQELVLQVPGAARSFRLGDGPEAATKPGDKSAFERLREALGKGEKVAGITGRVQGWKGLFPDVLRGEAEARKGEKPLVLVVTGFESARAAREEREKR